MAAFNVKYKGKIYLSPSCLPHSKAAPLYSIAFFRLLIK